jgi:hypothetical protein
MHFIDTLSVIMIYVIMLNVVAPMCTTLENSIHSLTKQATSIMRPNCTDPPPPVSVSWDKE